MNKQTNNKHTKKRTRYKLHNIYICCHFFFSFNDESSLIKLIPLMRMIGKNKHIISLCVFLRYATYKQVNTNKMGKENKRKNKKKN